MKRLTNNAIILVGEEVTRGVEAASYEVLIAKTNSSIEVVSESLETTVLSPNFGSNSSIPTQKVKNITTPLMPTGINTSGETDIAKFLSASSVVKQEPSSPAVYCATPIVENLVAHDITLGNACALNAPATEVSNFTTVAVTKNVVILRSNDGTMPLTGDVLNFYNATTTLTATGDGHVVTNIYALSPDNTLRKSLSIQYWQDDLLQSTFGVQGGFTWAFDELPTFTFEGTGTYNAPEDALVAPALSSTSCDTPALLSDIQLIVDGTPFQLLTCFEKLELKTNVVMATPTIPTVSCPTSIVTDVQPTFEASFAQIGFTDYPLYANWENNKRSQIVLSYGTEVGKRFIVVMTDCTINEAPKTDDVNGVQHNMVTYGVSKQCGSNAISNLTVINF